MKKYIGITIFLIGTIFASFWIALSSGKLKISENKKYNNISKINDSSEDKEIKKTNNTNSYLETKSENKINDKVLDNTKENINIIENSNTNNLEKKIELENNGYENNSKYENKKIKEKKENEFLFIGLAQLNLYSGEKYNDIYTFLGVESITTYKVEDKNIYIKKLNSIDYEYEKNIIQQLIQKIGGNIVETNLFGEKQLFVNPDIFYKKQVIMLVSYENKLYLVVLDYNDYKKYRKFLKEVLFAKAN